MTLEAVEKINRLLAQMPMVLLSDTDKYFFSESDFRIIEKHITAMSKELHMEIGITNFEFRFNKAKK